jgi:hypothetical protein
MMLRVRYLIITIFGLTLMISGCGMLEDVIHNDQPLTVMEAIQGTYQVGFIKDFSLDEKSGDYQTLGELVLEEGDYQFYGNPNFQAPYDDVPVDMRPFFVHSDGTYHYTLNFGISDDTLISSVDESGSHFGMIFLESADSNSYLIFLIRVSDDHEHISFGPWVSSFHFWSIVKEISR